MNDNRMRPIRETISLEAARALIDGAIRPIERTERVRLDAAGGRVVARPVEAQADVPPFARAAMDGYAVRAADTFGASTHDPRVLAWVETVFTGQVPTRPVGAAQCTEIATGAPVPGGLRRGRDGRRHREAARPQRPRLQSRLSRPERHEAGRRYPRGPAGAAARRRAQPEPHRRGRGAGRRSRSRSTRGRASPSSRRATRSSTRASRSKPGHIYDINKFTLSAILREHGAAPVPYPTAPDNVPDLERALEACLAEDVVIFSGGSSVGERDLILDVVDRMGEVLFHGIAVKPGKPTLFGTIDGHSRCSACPATRPRACRTRTCCSSARSGRWPGCPEWAPRIARLPLGQRVVSTTGRHQFYTVRIVEGQAMPAFKASGDITSMSQADGYIEIPAQIDVVEKGEPVDVTLF